MPKLQFSTKSFFKLKHYLETFQDEIITLMITKLQQRYIDIRY